MCMKFLTAFLILFNASFFTHNPDEISYDFVIDETSQTLTIHFTPKSAIDLLEHLKPELINKSVIKLADYLEDFTEYFNKTVALEIDDVQVHFKLRTRLTKRTFDKLGNRQLSLHMSIAIDGNAADPMNPLKAPTIATTQCYESARLSRAHTSLRRQTRLEFWDKNRFGR